MNSTEKISSKLRMVREHFGLNQKDFSNKIGVKQSYYSELEGGKRTITVKILEALLDIYGVSSDWVLIGDHNNIQFTKSDSKNQNSEYDTNQLIKQTRKEIEDFDFNFIALVESYETLLGKSDDINDYFNTIQESIYKTIGNLSLRYKFFEDDYLDSIPYSDRIKSLKELTVFKEGLQKEFIRMFRAFHLALNKKARKSS